jgi:hypothetical protein
MSLQVVAGNHASGTNWPAVSAWAAWATVLIYVVLGLFAWRQVHEARKLREEQARPFVIVDFEPGFLVYLTVENLGRTMARDVTIEFDKPLTTTLDKPHELDETPLFREPIPALPPGKKIRVLFDQFNDRVDKGLPLTYDVKLTYRGPEGRKKWEHPYRLDLGLYLGSTPPAKGLPEIAAELETIRSEIKKWTSSGGRGVLVHARDQERRDRMDRRRVHMRVLRSEGTKAFVRRLLRQALLRIGLS